MTQIDKYDYSKADHELKSLHSIFAMVAAFDQTPY
jgi:hypothetical protein